MKLFHLELLAFAVAATVRGANGTVLRGRDARELLPAPFIWQPYIIYDGLVGHGGVLSRDPSMTVLWRSSSSPCDFCWWNSTMVPSCATVSAESPGPLGTSDHFKFTITSGLKPSEKYDYEVTCGITTLGGSFKMPPTIPTSQSPESSTKILAYGDSRSDTTKHNRIAEQMLYEGTTSSESDWYGALALHTGDWANNGQCIGDWDNDIMSTSSSYSRLRELMSNTPINGCRGNHENGSGCGASAPFWTLFDKIFPYPFVDFSTKNPATGTPSALSFSIDYGNVHVAVIDQYTGPDAIYDRTSTSYGYCSTGYPSCVSCSAHYKWLEQDLAGANARDPKPVLFVVIHEPLYSVGGGHSNEVEPCFEKLLEDREVDVLILAGHNHYYSRAEKANPAKPGKKMYHITTGGGGYCCYNPDLPITAWPHVRKVVSVNHYCRIDSNTYDDAPPNDRYLCFEAIDIDGNMIDFFDIGTRPTEYNYCKCTTDLACHDGRHCNGEETCNLSSGTCVQVQPRLPCGPGKVCVEGSSGRKCGCSSLGNQDCKSNAPYCRWNRGRCIETATVFPTNDGTETECDDGVDNDFDGLVDCDDPDCSNSAACSGSTSGCLVDGDCDNGQFCDGVETCDSISGSCQSGSSPCSIGERCEEDSDTCVACSNYETLCNDGIDNDCDGLIDCADSVDCNSDPACLVPNCAQFTDKWSCRGQPTCRWDNKNKVCVLN